MTKSSPDQIGGLIWLALGILLCLGSVKLGLGTPRSPASGFAPFLTGCLLGLFGLILTLSSILRESDGKKSFPETHSRKGWTKGFLSLLILFLYAALVNTLGFIISTSLSMFFLFKIMEPRKWLKLILISVSTSLLSYLIFCIWLRVSFPKGIFGLG